jgi:selenocysteine lyase/cysteine desulfurase
MPTATALTPDAPDLGVAPAAVPTTAVPAARALFAAGAGYLDAATCGLAPRSVAAALHEAVDRWSTATHSLADYDAAVATSRATFARLVGVPTDRVAIGSQVSVLVGALAASLPDGAQVLVPTGEFTSITYPFLAQAHRGLGVRAVPIDRLAAEVRPGTDLVAFSLVQSADGTVADGPAIAAAARAVGARTLVDLTQAAGWMPVDAALFDLTVTGAYKWLCAPRGTAFATVAADAIDLVRPVFAGWYAGADVPSSLYGTTMRLADDARRLDVSPAWLTWVGAVPALELFAGLNLTAVRAHDVGLADAVRTGLGGEPAGTAIVALPDPDGARGAALTAAGIRASARAGGVRLAFHLWNDEADVDRVLTALQR